MKTIVLVISSVVLLCACGERQQGIGGGKQDTSPYKGTGVGGFTSPDWKAGDRNSWEQRLKTRAQYGQNDFSRIN